MKKLLILFWVLFFVVSCWSSSTTSLDDTDSGSTLVSHSWDGFSIDIPSNWEVLDSSWLTEPKDWAYKLIVSAKSSTDWFASNLIVLSKDLDEETTSYDFMSKNDPKDYSWYSYFVEDEVSDFKFDDWEKSELYIFDAKYNKDNDVLKFIQTWRVCDEKKSFFLTIWLSLNIKDTTKYEEMLKTFKCD